MIEWGIVMLRYRTPRVAEWSVRQVRRHEIRSTLRGVYPFGGMSRARSEMIWSVKVSFRHYLCHGKRTIPRISGGIISREARFFSGILGSSLTGSGGAGGWCGSHAQPLEKEFPSRRRSLKLLLLLCLRPASGICFHPRKAPHGQQKSGPCEG